MDSGGLLSKDEITKLRTSLENDKGRKKHNSTRADGSGRDVNVVVWTKPGNDVSGVLVRTEKIAGIFEKLLDGPVYHFHSKIIQKEPKVGGSHLWHQDYGYWYYNNILYPNAGTVWLAVDKATIENGCVQLLIGSHKSGRLDHHDKGNQLEANLDRVDMLKKSCPHLYAECDPGDAFFFHSNVLHTSSPNNSQHRRWGFVTAFNRADNGPNGNVCEPIQKLSNSAILSCNMDTVDDREYMDDGKQHLALQKVKEAAS